MIGAELRAIFGHWAGRATLVVAAVAAAGVVGALRFAQTQALRVAAEQGIDLEAGFDGNPIMLVLKAILELGWIDVAGWSLTVRNFFVLPLLLIFAAASTLATEQADHTLREVLVRGVSRWSVLMSKLAALLSLSGVSLLITFALSAGGGRLLFGASEGEPLRLIGGYAASWGSDLGLLALTLLVSCFLRSAGGVVVTLMLMLMLDLALRAGLGVLGMAGMENAAELAALLPGSALGCWEGWKAEAWEAEPFVGLAILVAVCLGGALARFQRMDVP